MDRVGRVIWIVLDGVGAGELQDAGDYGDRGAHTIAHTAKAVGGLRLPNLEALGLGNLAPARGLRPRRDAEGAFGKMREASPGKDSTTGHWELAGIILERPFPLYPHGFPPEVVKEFERRIGRKVLGNRPASGTRIIEELGEEHLNTGRPILYTSADSVFQLAAHKEVIPLEELYRMCRVARELLQGEHAVSRVIARPFVGRPGSFRRVGAERLDFSLPPPRPTVLDLCREAGLSVIGVGKVGDLFAGRGFLCSPHTSGNEETMERLLGEVKAGGRGILMANLVDFDMLYGHRRDPEGFAAALREVDDFLPQLKEAMDPRDLLLLVSDHGCDPTFRGTDHTREYGILLLWGPSMSRGVDLGTRETFADVGKSVADLLGVDGSSLDGNSFAALL
ncbi:MAG: phosphopentomutase [Actinomycetota bacterium]|nr:phosphopentomutase [Actinomycetota bacterium]MDI7251362.1 phosphopentomutase [Actinomycetota bacterium]